MAHKNTKIHHFCDFKQNRSLLSFVELCQSQQKITCVIHATSSPVLLQQSHGISARQFRFAVHLFRGPRDQTDWACVCAHTCACMYGGGKRSLSTVRAGVCAHTCVHTCGRRKRSTFKTWSHALCFQHGSRRSPAAKHSPNTIVTLTRYVLVHVLSAWQPDQGDRTQYEGADMPSADLPEHQLGTEPVPLPPDVNKLPKIRGYEGIGHSASGELSRVCVCVCVCVCVSESPILSLNSPKHSPR